FPAMIVGVITNTCILLCYFWKYLSVPEKDQEGGAAATGPEVVADDEVTSHRFTPARMSHASSVNGVDADCVSEPIRRSDSLNRADTHSMRSRSYNSEGDIQVAIRSMRASSMSQEMVEVSTVCDRRDDGVVGPRKITRTTSHQRSVIIEDAPEADA